MAVLCSLAGFDPSGQPGPSPGPSGREGSDAPGHPAGPPAMNGSAAPPFGPSGMPLTPLSPSASANSFFLSDSMTSATHEGLFWQYLLRSYANVLLLVGRRVGIALLLQIYKITVEPLSAQVPLQVETCHSQVLHSQGASHPRAWAWGPLVGPQASQADHLAALAALGSRQDQASK